MWNYVLLSTVVLFVSLLYHCYFNRPVSVIEHPNAHYDYIIVGAGTAGCVVASRLSEISNVTVLLVEAGGYFGWISSVPILAPMMQGTEVDWAYSTEPQSFSSTGFWNNVQNVPRGKGLGGSGQMNYLVHTFGRPEDYEEWPRGWSHADLLPYFKRVSDIMNIMSSPEEEYLTEAFLMAEESLKLSGVALQKGMYTVKKGSRWSTFQAYLQTAWNRRNLHILTNTLVSKILFKEEASVDGIKVTYRDGSVGRIRAREEVILCAGAINTPQLLLLSGIGSADNLDKFQIPVLSDLPGVGRNLFDHFLLPVYVNLEARISITLAKLQTLAEVFNYFVFGKGWYATNAVMGMGRVNNSGVMLFGMGSTEERILKALSNYRTELAGGFLVPLLLPATEKSRERFTEVHRHPPSPGNRPCLPAALRRRVMHAPGREPRASDARDEEVPQARGEGSPPRLRRVPTPAAGLSGHRVHGVRAKGGWPNELPRVRHLQDGRRPWCGCRRKIAREGRERTEGNRRQRAAVPRLRQSEFRDRRHSGARQRLDHGPRV
ncbi:glucose dehydrogenase [FAD, quinone] isoform X3 [Andrena cerasifolii]|uniref:glucose dehydrogenase [FAD, quinone] isoform X3 n=1 Tax=Andrena cerasifolii TaxID=2819439 RepID=UPI00403845AA